MAGAAACSSDTSLSSDTRAADWVMDMRGDVVSWLNLEWGEAMRGQSRDRGDRSIDATAEQRPRQVHEDRTAVTWDIEHRSTAAAAGSWAVEGMQAAVRQQRAEEAHGNTTAPAVAGSWPVQVKRAGG